MTLSSESRPVDHGFLVETYRRPACTSLDIVGAVTRRSINRLEAILMGELNRVQAGHHLRLDLARCTALSDEAIQALATAYERATEREVVLYLARVPDDLAKRITVQRYSRLLQPPWV